MTREEIMQLNTEYLNGRESEHKMNELFNYVLELQKHEQQQTKIGHWTYADDDSNWAMCGCCNRLNYAYGNYCKHCGAKIIEPKESEE